jgi:hypothetical protein
LKQTFTELAEILARVRFGGLNLREAAPHLTRAMACSRLK